MENVTDPQGVKNEITSDDADEEEEGEDLIGPNILEILTMPDQVCKCSLLDEKTLVIMGKIS